MSPSNNMSNFVKQLNSLSEVVEQTHHYEKTLFDLKTKIDKNKVFIKKELNKSNKKSQTIRSSDKVGEFLVKINTDVNLEFNVSELQKTLNKERFDKVTDKKVVINDLNKLIELMKAHGVKPKQFKDLISVEHEVNNEKLDHLISIEEISVSELHGCYKADFTEEITVRKIK